ncbi:MAG: hypothetical protein NVS4B11_26410 [Ktedonobacteraceae bacterium]
MERTLSVSQISIKYRAFVLLEGGLVKNEQRDERTLRNPQSERIACFTLCHIAFARPCEKIPLPIVYK